MVSVPIAERAQNAQLAGRTVSTAGDTGDAVRISRRLAHRLGIHNDGRRLGPLRLFGFERGSCPLGSRRGGAGRPGARLARLVRPVGGVRTPARAGANTGPE